MPRLSGFPEKSKLKELLLVMILTTLVLMAWIATHYSSSPDVSIICMYYFSLIKSDFMKYVLFPVWLIGSTCLLILCGLTYKFMSKFKRHLAVAQLTMALYSLGVGIYASAVSSFPSILISLLATVLLSAYHFLMLMMLRTRIKMY